MGRSDDAIPQSVASGFIWGFVAFFVLAFFGASCGLRSCENEKRDYLRRYVARSAKHQPCTNGGFDWAMGVDCKALIKAKEVHRE